MTKPTDLKAAPLFSDLSDAELELVLGASTRRDLSPEDVLFEKGAAPGGLCVLVDGALSVRDEDGERFLVRGTSPVGELSVFTGEERRLSAVAVEPSVVLEIPRSELQRLLAEHGGLAVSLMSSLLRIAARKIARDQRRLREMRANIVSTQKAMKRMQDALLDGDDNPLHAALFEELDALIEQNKKAHYLVEPSRLVPTQVRFDDGTLAWVNAISNEWLYFECPAGMSFAAGSEFSAVLVLAGRELPVSGTVEKVTPREVVVFVDELIDPFAAELTDHLARAQMLDIVL